jgi:hypothetical protein
MTIALILIVLVALLLALYLAGQEPQPGSANAPGRSRLITKTTSVIDAAGSRLVADVVVLENYDLAGFIEYLEKHKNTAPAMERLLDMYKIQRHFPDLSNFRLGPNMFDQILLNWIIFLDSGGAGASKGDLIGHGVAAQIYWDGTAENLPDGWQGSVRVSYQNEQVDHKEPNSLVGLFIFVEENYRKHGWAHNIIEEMKRVGERNRLPQLIIPLRPPSRYKKEYASMPMSEFAALKREDGQPLDHWVRLHVRLGAKVLGVSNTSHQHAFPLKDFHQQFPAPVIKQSGYTLVQQRDGGWYNVYADLERDFVLVNQGCVWVQHPLSGDAPVKTS